MKNQWFRHGFLNTLEHGLTRVADALTTIVLIWAMPTEAYAKLALAQAQVAPLLFVFVSPETVIYRDFAAWKRQGIGPLAARVRALRLFAWGKAQVAIVIAALAAALFDQVHFSAMIWAFSLALAPQIAGADREFLRLELRLKELNAISLYQKLTLLIGTAIVGIWFSGQMGYLALVAAGSALSTAWLASIQVKRTLKAQGADSKMLAGQMGPLPVETLTESLRSFTIWSHVSGVLMNWIQTMDLFFLGLFGFPAREIGLYAAALKLANFSFALPMALSNLFSVSIGRKFAERTRDFTAQRRAELSQVKSLTLYLLAGSVVQGAVLLAIASVLIGVLSRGRWTPEEQAMIWNWLAWILGGGILFCSTFLISTWLTIRDSIARLFWQVYLPWGLFSAAIYAVAIHWGGFSGAAMANPVIGLMGVLLFWLYSFRVEKPF